MCVKSGGAEKKEKPLNLNYSALRLIWVLFFLFSGCSSQRWTENRPITTSASCCDQHAGKICLLQSHVRNSACGVWLYFCLTCMCVCVCFFKGRPNISLTNSYFHPCNACWWKISLVVNTPTTSGSISIRYFTLSLEYLRTLTQTHARRQAAESFRIWSWMSKLCYFQRENETSMIFLPPSPFFPLRSYLPSEWVSAQVTSSNM